MKWPGWPVFWKRLGERRLGLFVGLGALVLDQISKIIVENLIPRHHGLVVIPDFFHLIHHQNTGVAWGFLRELPGVRWILVGVTLVAAVLMLVWLALEERPRGGVVWGLGLVIGGALGNLVDRIRLGAVVDFLRFNVGEFVWPSFNVADAAIVIGVALVLINYIFLGGTVEPSAAGNDRG